jgi:hypothetical protein
MLGGVVRVHEERRQHLLLDYPLLLEMFHRSSNEEPHAVAAINASLHVHSKGNEDGVGMLRGANLLSLLSPVTPT